MGFDQRLRAHLEQLPAAPTPRVAWRSIDGARLEQRAADKTSATRALVVPVDAADLDRWITSDDRVDVLTELYKRAVFDKAR